MRKGSDSRMSLVSHPRNASPALPRGMVRPGFASQVYCWPVALSQVIQPFYALVSLSVKRRNNSTTFMAGDERCSALGFSISSVHAQSCPPLCDSTDCSQVPLSMEFSRQEYWSELPFPPPGDLPHPGIEPSSLALAGILYCSATREA